MLCYVQLLGGWLAAEAVLLQILCCAMLCSVAGWPFYAVKYTGLSRWVAGRLLSMCFYKPYAMVFYAMLWQFYAVKYTGLYRWVAGWLLRLCFYKPYAMLCYVQLMGGLFVR